MCITVLYADWLCFDFCLHIPRALIISEMLFVSFYLAASVASGGDSNPELPDIDVTRAASQRVSLVCLCALIVCEPAVLR